MDTKKYNFIDFLNRPLWMTAIEIQAVKPAMTH